MLGMALSIKTSEADALARELAAATHESLTEAVTVALRERLARIREAEQLDVGSRLLRLANEYSSLTVLDHRPADDILGYDEHGLP